VDAGLLPVKELAVAKQRLASAFSDEHRIQVSRALLQDALDLCGKTPFLHWYVITGDAEVAAEARSRDLDVVEDPGSGLNDALAAGIATAKAAGAKTITILPSDVPLATADDVRDLFDTGATSDIALVPSHSDGGTNALFLSPPDALTPRFGPASLTAHLKEGEAGGLRCSILGLERLALDVDTPEDARALVEIGGESRTVEILRRLLES
jgi:2-phospho-L-lactate guanylyltransferase